MKNRVIAIMGVLTAIGMIAAVSFTIMNPAVDENTKGYIGIASAIIAVVAHIAAIVKVKRGTLTVYRNWKDFGLSCTWPIAAIIAFVAFFARVMMGNDGADTAEWIKTACMVGGCIFAIVTVISLVWMFVGAFTNNQGRFVGGMIALFARTTATLLFLTWLGKFFEMKEGLDNSNIGINDYIKSVTGFILFGIWFKILVVPLVKDNREDTCIEH